MQNKITQTIMESLEEFDLEYAISPTPPDKQAYLKSHLLQSQIKVIEVVIENLKSMYKNFYLSDERYAIQINKDYEDYTALHGLNVYNKALEDQISSLNETLEELKKSL